MKYRPWEKTLITPLRCAQRQFDPFARPISEEAMPPGTAAYVARA
jgi:hypothetical protein